MSSRKWLLCFVVLGLLLRVVFLGVRPIGFTPDEASFGYDAYSLIETGKDQWGNAFPINFKSFGDYKLPVYTYLLMPFVYIFELSVFIVRLPGALIGSLSIVATYLLAKNMFKNEKISLLSAFFVATSSWHIFLSRGAFEANLATFFFPAAIVSLYMSKKNIKYLYLSLLFLFLSVFSYHTARILSIPLYSLFFVSIYRTESIKKLRSPIFLFGIIFIILTTISAMLSGGSARLASSSIFSTAENIYSIRFNQIVYGEPELLVKVFNNSFTYIATTFYENYLSYFSFEFLFNYGPGEWTYGMIPGIGVLYSFEIVTLLFALFQIYKKPSLSNLLLVLWIAISVVPAALTVGPGRAANRAAFMMPAIQMFSAFGAYYTIIFFKKIIGRNLTHIVSIVVFCFSFAFVAESYIYAQPNGARQMLYGSEQVVKYIQDVERQYEHIIVTKSLSEPHIFFAFYSKIDPYVFQNIAQSWKFEQAGFGWVDQQPEYTLGKITFRDIDWQRERNIQNAIVVARPNDIPENITPVYTVYYPDGKEAYIFIDTRSKAFASTLHE